MNRSKAYFDKYAHHHAYHRDPDFYSTLAHNIKKLKPERKLKILDIGCGDGSFIRDMITSGILAEFIGIDLSDTMIYVARKNLKDSLIELIVGDGFNMPMRSDIKFDLIHIDSVLHHLTADTRTHSMVLIDRLIQILVERLNEGGILVIEEVYYISYAIPHFTPFVIFYGLKLINLLRIDVSKIFNDIRPGLEVNFLSDREIEELLQKHDLNCRLIRRIQSKVRMTYRLFLLKDYGYISYIATADPKGALIF